MAAFGQPSSAQNPPPTPPAPSSSNRPLPNGPCNYRDLTCGSCGCNQFWDQQSTELHEGSSKNPPSNERSTWCVCGHHACFHLHNANFVSTRPVPQIAAADCIAHTKCDPCCYSITASQCDAHKGMGLVGEAQLGRDECQERQLGHSKTPKASQRSQQPHCSQNNTAVIPQQSVELPSQPSTSGLPRIPSVCLLSSRESHSVSESETRQSLSTVPDDFEKQDRRSFGEPELPSTRANSTADANQLTPIGAGMDRVMDFNRSLPQLAVSDTMPDTFNPDEFLQSATEIATPSNANTPDLRNADQALQDTKKVIETLACLASNGERRAPVPDTRPNSAASGSSRRLLLTNSPSTPQEHLQQALRSASPQALQRIVSYLTPLHNLLNSMPDVSNTIRELCARLDTLERNSFAHAQPDEVNNQFDLVDGRILELEHRMDDHDRVHAAIDADVSSAAEHHPLVRRRPQPITDSFNSNHSSHSTTSSALIVAAMDRKELETEFEGIKDRIGALEAQSMPSLVQPWQVEVVFLPWGRDLRGIWFSSEEPMHDPSKGITQDAEDWTQARNMRSSSRSSISYHDAESGWSSQAISDWADTMDEWLSPKACGSKNLVYNRLRSRGFIRNATIKSSNAGNIQATLSSTFNDLLEHLECISDADGSQFDTMNEAVETYPGLRASFIPLRKVMKSSRLQFLTRAELASSALWSAQFLASGVIMKVSGGHRRLYVTQREAYLQQTRPSNGSWTWQRLRELPRCNSDLHSQIEGNEEQCQPQVAEADAREACWAFYPPYDPPPGSSNSSFSSSGSAQLPIRPTEQLQYHRSITPTSILRIKQPISPVSEFPPRRPLHQRNRTVSAPMTEEVPQMANKRRFNRSFEYLSRNSRSSPVGGHSHSNSASISKAKRRRVTHSPSPTLSHSAPQGQVTVWTTNTPRRSREPPSPFFSSHPELPRTNSDTGSRSQRSMNVLGKSTPFAYATPYSGPIATGNNGFGEFEEGDTEADSDGGSWHGVDDEDSNDSSDDGGNSSGSDVEAGVHLEDQASFSADESGFGSEDESHSHVEDDIRGRVFQVDVNGKAVEFAQLVSHSAQQLEEDDDVGVDE